MKSKCITLGLSLFTAAFFPACGDDSVACTEIAVASVQVKVVDASNTVVMDAQVTFTLDGGPVEEAQCAVPPVSGGGCGEWITAYERAGTFVVTAKSADGMKTASQTVLVEKDACHVITESITLTLQ